MKSVWLIKLMGIAVALASLTMMNAGVHAQEFGEFLKLGSPHVNSLNGFAEHREAIEMPVGSQYAILVSSAGQHRFTLRDAATDEAIAMAQGPVSNAIFCIHDSADLYYLDAFNESDVAFTYTTMLANFDTFCDWSTDSAAPIPQTDLIIPSSVIINDQVIGANNNDSTIMALGAANQATTQNVFVTNNNTSSAHTTNGNGIIATVINTILEPSTPTAPANDNGIEVADLLNVGATIDPQEGIEVIADLPAVAIVVEIPENDSPAADTPNAPEVDSCANGISVQSSTSIINLVSDALAACISPEQIEVTNETTIGNLIENTLGVTLSQEGIEVTNETTIGGVIENNLAVNITDEGIAISDQTPISDVAAEISSCADGQGIGVQASASIINLVSDALAACISPEQTEISNNTNLGVIENDLEITISPEEITISDQTPISDVAAEIGSCADGEGIGVQASASIINLVSDALAACISPEQIEVSNEAAVEELAENTTDATLSQEGAKITNETSVGAVIENALGATLSPEGAEVTNETSVGSVAENTANATLSQDGAEIATETTVGEVANHEVTTTLTGQGIAVTTETAVGTVATTETTATVTEQATTVSSTTTVGNTATTETTATVTEQATTMSNTTTLGDTTIGTGVTVNNGGVGATVTVGNTQVCVKILGSCN